MLVMILARAGRLAAARWWRRSACLALWASPARMSGSASVFTQFSRMEQWLEVPGLIKRLPEMELVWAQPGEAWADFDFDTDYQIRVGGHPFRLRVAAAPGGARYTVTFWRRAVLELDHLPSGWRLKNR